MLNRAATKNKLKFHAKCKSTRITHLSFMDDLLIFTDGPLESLQQVLMVLREFELRSGLKVSMEKTSFVVSWLTEHETQLIQATAGMNMGSLPFHYLGVPLNSKKLNLVSCEPLLHQIKAKLSSWSVKSLLFAGKLLLIKTIIARIKTFWCSSFILPKACVRRITSSVVFSCGKVMWRAGSFGFCSSERGRYGWHGSKKWS